MLPGPETRLNDAQVALWMGICGGMTTLGYLWGKKKDKKNVTLVIR